MSLRTGVLLDNLLNDNQLCLQQPGGNGTVEGEPAGADVEMEPENPIPTDSAPQAGAAVEGLPEGGEVTLGDGLPAGGVAALGEGEQDPIAAQMALVAEDFPAGQELFAPARPSSGGTPQEAPRKGGRGGKRKAANSEDGTPGTCHRLPPVPPPFPRGDRQWNRRSTQTMFCILREVGDRPVML